MPDLHLLFLQAQSDVKSLAERPDNPTLLQLYAWYKQACEGDAAGERPGAMDFVARAKFDAWDHIRGTSREKAMQAYIELVNTLMAD
jgi:diazepam-binding inhibitor (GABA receptor modulating acyl-CoA-binding protein)